MRQIGFVEYDAGLTILARTAEEVRGGDLCGILLVLRHPKTITLGRRTEPGELHGDARSLQGLGIGLCRVERGGGATYHYPEQAVVYPVVSLSRCRLDLDRLIGLLGSAVLSVLEADGVKAQWDPERPGVYVDGAKIASVGLHLSRDVVTHGVALNVGPDVSGFDHIDPCKERGLKVTSLSHLVDDPPDPDAVGAAVARQFIFQLLDRP
ncbi:MAG: lipoyl(octanoyl) transferase LipB [Deltaproteobacteria bacterium]|nr:lipoyl(octanoyl) transferase LipB [Deltaproteobacteria bacterium]